MTISLWILFGLAIVGAFVLQMSSSAFRALEHIRSKEQLKATHWFFLYRKLQRIFFPTLELEALFFSVSCTKHILRYALPVVIAFLLWNLVPSQDLRWLWLLVGFILFLGVSLAIGDFIPRALASRHPETSLNAVSSIASLYLFAAAPLSTPILLLSGKAFASHYLEEVNEPVDQVKEKIMEMIEEADAVSSMDIDEKRLLTSVAEFRDRIVREVMTPRIDTFALPAQMPLSEAASQLNEEGYSRAPVYRESLDQIVGVLMYKDIMAIYIEGGGAVGEPIEKFVKPVIYVPETSRVSQLLQEFRDKQTHLAIVVDEYGGTEGIITIEDCLEEIVGEIADEYDEEEEQLYTVQPSGGWIVDARMTINDIEEEFGLKIPQEGEYDTVGGYAFHQAGEIPQAGLKIHHDDFELEILESSDRCVEKVKIVPTKGKKFD